MKVQVGPSTRHDVIPDAGRRIENIEAGATPLELLKLLTNLILDVPSSGLTLQQVPQPMLSISVSLSDGLPFGWRQEVAIPAPGSLPCSALQLIAYGISERNAAVRGAVRKMPALPIDKHLSVARSVSYGVSESAGCCWSNKKSRSIL